MKILLSLNNKFFEKSPVELIRMIQELDVNNYVSGFELYIDFYDKSHIEYAKELAYLSKNNNYLLQFHGNSDYPLEDQKQYMLFLNDIAKTLEYKINVVLHPLSLDTIEDNVEKSNLYFSEILNYIYQNQLAINVSIENLNSNETPRLSKDYLTSILANNMDLSFTYDVGHEIVDYGNLTDLNPVLLNRLSNVHFHTFHFFYDHQPVGMDSDKKWVKAFRYLKTIHFDKTLVLEYDFYDLGNDFSERMINYIKCVEYIYDYI